MAYYGFVGDLVGARAGVAGKQATSWRVGRILRIRPASIGGIGGRSQVKMSKICTKNVLNNTST